ncbi:MULTISPECIES: lytic transglycosylase [Pseudomonas]|uniref:Lytic transglycosylase n=1 Tax=Pseudomonas fluorescens TaxID=294 RepID=A0A944HAW0_PSEFL|nr:lytic transglycosylase [Pseudomonas fluorescens]MBT2298201.1 lytic transglycosylase [Pseudomonas fluorescens]MBT2309676.1 lytic transglycosylase [Pseudomonas fluorescens]MBT2314839.1 lytic transglycosylase [Pseudomonas fluorescens]MBT2327745.1 lytic transglycosylase [Pseudomonas fluorescens]MBT2345492.1 lytic transglycosylase [Pseudomonas fluorescens]
MAASQLSSLALMLTALTVQANELPPPAYQLAAQDADIPSTVLFAITLQESGIRARGRLLPWPWTLNIAGTPYRFATRPEACQALLEALSHHDAKRVDVGLGQTNLGYHGQRFASPCDALDPYRNLAVTAELLREHHAATGDWVLAAGRYHRPAGGAPAARYRAGFSQQLERLLVSFDQVISP